LASGSDREPRDLPSSGRLKLLFLAPQPPFPADQGTKLRNQGLIRIAAEAGHEVHLLTFAGRGQPACVRGSARPVGGTSRPREILTPEVRAGLQRWCSSIVAVPTPPIRCLPRRTFDLALSGRPDL